MKTILIVGFTLLLPISTAIAKEVLIPRSTSGDKGQYYLIESKKTGNTISVLHKRIGVYATDFTRTETNCKTMKMREIDTGEGSASAIQVRPTKWFDLVEGSSKSDLAHFLCKK